MRTYLVAFVATSQGELVDALVDANFVDHDGIDCWWIAEDDRIDGSDNDSAIFVPWGAQADAASHLRAWYGHNTERWREEGYPYRSDVSWWPYPYQPKHRREAS